MVPSFFENAQLLKIYLDHGEIVFLASLAWFEVIQLLRLVANAIESDEIQAAGDVAFIEIPFDQVLDLLVPSQVKGHRTIEPSRVKHLVVLHLVDVFVDTIGDTKELGIVGLESNARLL